MKKHILPEASLFLALWIFSAGTLGAEDDVDVDHFILPETPPTIERIKKPPLDQPYLKKQNFVSEFDLSPAPVVMNFSFHKMFSRDNPVRIGLYSGSFASRGGSFVYASTKNVDASYSMSSTGGEYPNLSQEKNAFGLNVAKKASDNKYFRASAQSEENFIWLEHKYFYGFNSDYSWYARRNLNVKAGVSYEKGEIKGQDINEAVSGSLALSWQPFESQNANIYLGSQKDTSVGTEPRFDLASFRYDVMLFSKTVLGGGARYVIDEAFPQGYFAVGLAPGLKFSVNYLSGVEKLNWNRLYSNDRYVAVNKAVLYPESVYSFTENLSYYSNADNSIDLEVSQAHWKKYYLWQSFPGTDFITPVNAVDVYAASGRIKAAFRKEWLSVKLGGEHNINDSLTFTPDYRFSAAIECLSGSWSFGLGYEYNGPVHYLAGNGAQLAGNGNLSVTSRKDLSGDIEVYALCDNALSEKIETQPGFVRNAPMIYIGLNIKL